jgi:hypothetical protein
MFRSIAACLLVAAVASAGCATLTPQYANDSTYCLDQYKGGGCSELEGDGSCQPCPTSTMREAHADTPTIR